ncbi:translocation protein Sec62 [Penicillium longicatenatum]|uniref:translocation protein Sec62 n=1 Tax=Penicillium longicatenatum TaxID=1561947 RepID=UPI00254952D3|nr:translocation protein Sec62 [Penicillium longicatenatum]KAJ5651417.1 translocation protein Sec62 [Penicillium longicatenatum]
MAQPGQPTREQLAFIAAQNAEAQRQLNEEAERRNIPVAELVKEKERKFLEFCKAQGKEPEEVKKELIMKRQNQMMQATGEQQQKGPQTQRVAVSPGQPVDPRALAVAKFLRSQALKPRTCILNGERKDMFKVKRAMRALQSPAYAKAAAKKNSLLPPVTDYPSAEAAFSLLPLSYLALRVSKHDPHAGHNHAKPKNRTKGLWTVKIEEDQKFEPMMYYVWQWEGPQWKQKAMAAAVVAGIFTVVLFPLWPMMLRQGVWYLSVGCMGLLGLFFAMAIFRLILFCVTVFAVPPGLWLYPNLFADVGFFDSFKPLWGWQENKKKKGKKVKSEAAAPTLTTAASTTAPSATTTSAEATTTSSPAPVKRDLTARVEEVEE